MVDLSPNQRQKNGGTAGQMSSPRDAGGKAMPDRNHWELPEYDIAASLAGTPKSALATGYTEEGALKAKSDKLTYR